jgi:hypothetical protein
MKKTSEAQSAVREPKAPVVPTHGNWAEERGFGQQTSPAANLRQYDLKLIDPPQIRQQVNPPSPKPA